MQEVALIAHVLASFPVVLLCFPICPIQLPVPSACCPQEIAPFVRVLGSFPMDINLGGTDVQTVLDSWKATGER